MNSDLSLALSELQATKGISQEVIMEAIAKALEKSYEKNYREATNVEVVADYEECTFHVFQIKEVVEEVKNPIQEISIQEAIQKQKTVQIGDKIRIEIQPTNFGRIAAQTARNIIIQKLRDAERSSVYNEFSDYNHELILGNVQRMDLNNVYVDLGRAEGLIMKKEQIPGEILRVGDRVKAYVLDVRSSNRGPQILLSRSHPNLVVRLFEQEVPEIEDGVVEIYSIAREAGSRSKIAVFSKDPNVDPIGAFVGYKGGRVNYIVDELHGEKMDIIVYDEDPKRFIANALSPSQVNRVLLKSGAKEATVVVPDDQLSLAIGKEGQNVRLAARVSGWKIDIKSDSNFQEADYLDYEEKEEDQASKTIALFAMPEDLLKGQEREEGKEPEADLEDVQALEEKPEENEDPDA